MPPPCAPLTVAVPALGLPLGQRVAVVAWSLGEWAAKNPREVAGRRTPRELKLQTPGTCSIVPSDFTDKSQTQK